MASESDFIDWVRAQPLAGGLVAIGPGDDLAVLRWPAEELLIVGADQVLDGVHFDSARHGPRDIGRKAMNRNLSDCAAMACLPAAAIATVALPRGAGSDYAKQLFVGLRDAGAAFDCSIVGGDTGSWDGRLALSVAIFGRSANVAPITRSGARPGNRIYVTGPLGGSILGRHMTFTPRVELARALAMAATITAMIDLSDGLSRDVARICRDSGVGAIIDADRIPIHDDALQAAGRDGVPPLDHALHDGEDYELLFTSAGHVDAALAREIGSITTGSAVSLRTAGGMAVLEPRGWEHAW